MHAPVCSIPKPNSKIELRGRSQVQSIPTVVMTDFTLSRVCSFVELLNHLHTSGAIKLTDLDPSIFPCTECGRFAVMILLRRDQACTERE